jgi:hypothetical protein
VRCEELSVGQPFAARQVEEPKVHELPESQTYVEPVRPPTPVYDAPGGRELFSYEYSESSSYPLQIETRGKFVRIAARFDNIAIDAWVPADEVAVPVRISGYTRAYAPKVRTSTVHHGLFAIAPSGADLYVGQPGSLAPAGRLVKNARVRPRGADDDFVAIVTLDGITAPRDLDFWVRRSQLAECQVPEPAP